MDKLADYKQKQTKGEADKLTTPPPRRKYIQWKFNQKILSSDFSQGKWPEQMPLFFFGRVIQFPIFVVINKFVSFVTRHFPPFNLFYELHQMSYFWPHFVLHPPVWAKLFWFYDQSSKKIQGMNAHTCTFRNMHTHTHTHTYTRGYRKHEQFQLHFCRICNLD